MLEKLKRCYLSCPLVKLVKIDLVTKCNGMWGKAKKVRKEMLPREHRLRDSMTEQEAHKRPSLVSWVGKEKGETCAFRLGRFCQYSITIKKN